MDIKDKTKTGYHLVPITSGTYGYFSKIKEEFEELTDAINQNANIMILNELSDLIGAIEGFVNKKFNLTLDDLLTMSQITKRAFESGERKDKPIY